jgi:hypothetical protein
MYDSIQDVNYSKMVKDESATLPLQSMSATVKGITLLLEGPASLLALYIFSMLMLPLFLLSS